MDDNQIPVEIVKTPPPVSSYFKTLSAVLGVFVLVAGLGIAVKLSQQKQETRTKASADMVDLSLSADKTEAAPLEEINLAIGVNPHNYKVTAVQLDVRSTSNIEIVSLTPGTYLTTILEPEDREGESDIRITLGSGTTPVTGPGILANLKVKIRSGASGTGTVTIDSGSLVSGIDTSGNAVGTSILGDVGKININVIPTQSLDKVDLNLLLDQANYIQNEEVNIAVGMNTHAYKVTAVDLRISYDAGKFDYVSFTKTTALPTILVPASATNGFINASLGSEASNPSTGNTTIANLVLRIKSGVNSGTSLLKIDTATEVAGIDSNGNAIATSILGNAGEATVNFTQILPTPTPTSLPSPTPTPLGASPTPTPITVVKIGDANGDNKVDGTDYVVWVNNYNKTTANKAIDGDFNEDGKVDGVDYVIWVNNYL